MSDDATESTELNPGGTLDIIVRVPISEYPPGFEDRIAGPYLALVRDALTESGYFPDPIEVFAMATPDGRAFLAELMRMCDMYLPDADDEDEPEESP